ncbi:unnamed protein product [Sympodiomycopsis kandeliae]
MVPILKVISAPHGRFSIPSSKLNLNGNLAWFVMEVVSPIGFIVAFLSQPLTSNPVLKGSSISLQDIWSPSLARLPEIPSANIFIGSLFVLHYIQRAVVSPIRSPKRSPIHLSVPLSAILFNLINGFMMGSWLGGRSPAIHLPSSLLSCGKLQWHNYSSNVTISFPGLITGKGLSPILSSPLAITSLLIWTAGLLSNMYHDEVLLDLRREPHKRVTKAMREDKEDKSAGYASNGQTKYGIPKGGLYKWTSFPNYLSEWSEWLAYSILTFSLSRVSPAQLASSSSCQVPFTTTVVLFLLSPPFLFLLAEFSAMFPRALKGHEWYHDKFGVQGDGKGGTYPKGRKAIFPGLL